MKTEMGSIEKKPKSIPAIELPRLLTHTLDQLQEPYGIKDLESRFVYANQAMVNLLKVKSSSDIVGNLDNEIDSRLLEDPLIVAEFQRQDRLVTTSLQRMSMLEIHPKAVEAPYVCKKIPLLNDNKESIGVICYTKNLEVYTLNDFVKGSMPGSLLLNKPDDFFTERECELMFLRLQNMKCKDIADITCCSLRTVENCMCRLYARAGVNNLDEFKGFCEKKQYHRYVPVRFLTYERICFEKQPVYPR